MFEASQVYMKFAWRKKKNRKVELFGLSKAKKWKYAESRKNWFIGTCLDLYFGL